MKQIVGLIGLVVLSAGCSSLKLGPKYQAIGQYGVAQTAGPKVNADQVEVFVKTAPEGFTLEKNELSVVEGYDHKILGVVKAVSKGGYCDISEVGMKDVVKVLQEETAAHGGNAVIYVESKLSDPSTEGERCSRENYGGDRYFGAGWAVVRGSAHPSKSAEVAPPAPSDAATATPAGAPIPAP